MPADSPEAIRGKPIDGCPLPDWARPYLSPDQLSLDRGLLWVLLIYKARNLGSSATSIAQRLYVHTLGKAQKKAWPSQPALAGDLELKSENTVRAALSVLEQHGWLVKGDGPRGRNSFTLAWPPFDCLAPTPIESPALCAVPTDNGLCRRRAGWGTGHRGAGRCKLHDDAETPQWLRGSDDPNEASPPQPLSPDPSTIEGSPPQPLRQTPSTVEGEYVSECVTQVREESNEGCPPSRAEVEVPLADLESDVDRVVDEGEGEPADEVPPVESKHLTPLPDLCAHGVPGGFLPGPKRKPDEKYSPQCIICWSHVDAAVCLDPTHCPKCLPIHTAAGHPPMSAAKVDVNQPVQETA